MNVKPASVWSKAMLGRWLAVLVVTGLLSYVSWRNLHLEQDVVGSIEKSRPKEAAIFNQLQGGGLFQNSIFIHLTQPDSGLESKLLEVLAQAGYELTASFQGQLKSPRELYRLLPFLPEATVRQLLSPEHTAEVAAQVRAWLSLPGSMGLIKMLADDPLLLSMALPKMLQSSTGKASNDAPPLVARRTAAMDYEKTRSLYRFLQEHDQQLSFASGDFFALENYDVVQADMALCSLLSIVASLVVFRLFCRRWLVLALLLAGTWVSSVTGLLAAEWLDGTIYGLVLAMASTFLSFNNETLVHLAGHSHAGKSPDRSSLVGVFSALGTTVIGFLVLLFSSSRMARQMGVISLGSMIGFLLFLGLFGGALRTLQFRALHLPQWRWTRPVLALTFIAVALALATVPLPALRTDLNTFRYASPYLEAETNKFSANFSGLGLDNLQAIPLKASLDPAEAYQKLLQEQGPGGPAPRFHPLAWFMSEQKQGQRLPGLRAELGASLERVRLALRSEGLNFTMPSDLGELTLLPSRAYLQLWGQVLPIPWYIVDQEDAHLLVFFAPKVPVAGAIPLHPKAFYEFILNDLARQIGVLFVIGLAAMLVYLIPWQRDWAKVALIFLPLMIAALGLQVFFLITGRSLTIVHVMGLTLVIGVALDYSAILVSTAHDPVSQGKVALTGGLTLVSFGSLLLARHPVLKELALIVVIGTLVAFLMALFTAMPAAKIKATS